MTTPRVPDPRRLPTFHVRVLAASVDETKRIAEALLDVPQVSDEDVARLVVSTSASAAATTDAIDAYVLVREGSSANEASAESGELSLLACARDDSEAHTKPVFHVRRDNDAKELVSPDPVARLFVLGPKLEGIDVLRAALLDEAMRLRGITVDRARRAKRPYASAIIAGAALMASAEGVLPGAAAFVVGTQVSAIASLHYLYTGKWMGRAHVMTLLPVFASEAAGGSLFLLVKSALPPTGVGDIAAAIVAGSMTLAMLGAVAGLLEQGYTLDEKEKLRQAFERMQAKTKAERGRLVRERHRWKDKTFFRDLVRRLVFE